MISPLPSEEGVSEMVIVVGVTSSSTTRGRIGGGGAEINMYKHRLIQLLSHKQCNAGEADNIGSSALQVSVPVPYMYMCM